MAYNKEIAVKEALSQQHRATYSMQWDLRDGKQADKRLILIVLLSSIMS